jgi:hypothetical protein
MTSRDALAARWFDLTRRALPALAARRGWPVRADHCFQRILLDNAFEGRWYDHVAGRPAYAHADPAALERAIALGEAAIADTVDLHHLNRQSLAWRRAPSQPRPTDPISPAGESPGTKIERTA